MNFCLSVPASPPNDVTATAASPTSIMVTWDVVSPLDHNGLITIYEVLYEPMETFSGAIGPLTVNVTERSSLLTGLQDYVEYTISVRAYTSEGEGPYSVGVIERTNETGNLHTHLINYILHLLFFSSFQSSF